jgi:hypothetical protein
VNVHIDKAAEQSAPLALAIELDAPLGWTYVGSAGLAAPPVQPNPGDTGALSFVWLTPPSLPADFSITLNAPDEPAAYNASFTARALLRFTTGPERHTADSSMTFQPAEPPLE